MATNALISQKTHELKQNSQKATQKKNVAWSSNQVLKVVLNTGSCPDRAITSVYWGTDAELREGWHENSGS